MGRKPTPPKLKLLRGNPGKRKLLDVVALPSTKPDCPAFLNAVAKAMWRKLVKWLEAAGSLQRSDANVMAMYCSAWADWVEANAELAAAGKVVKSKTGVPMHNPWRSVERDAKRELTKLGAKLGLSPIDRKQLGVSGDKAPGKLAKYVN